jgi:hypothetical protein
MDGHRIALEERVPLSRPRVRGAAFDAIEERVLSRVLGTPREEHAWPHSAQPAEAWRWAT